MHIFAIGPTGLVGTRIKELLKGKHEIDNLSIETGTDITSPETLRVIEEDSLHQIVLHLAAKVDVDGCEKDKELGSSGDAYRLNILGTQNVVNACLKSRKKIIYISTDFVFDGEKSKGESYTEQDEPHPINWYGKTKYEGEKIVLDSGLPYMIVRIAYPYSSVVGPRKDFVQAIGQRLVNGQAVTGITDHFMSPTFLDDIAYALDGLINHEAQGIFHVVGNQSISPYDAALAIADHFGYDKSLISQTTREVFFAGRAPRPFNLSMNNDKIRRLGITMKSFEEGLREIKV